MTEVFDFHPGTSALLVSVPHDGRRLPAVISDRMTAAGRAIADTDWHVNRLYTFARGAGASVLSANYSRYVVDLNRPDSDESLYPDQLSTGLCPASSFGGEDLYGEGTVIGEGEIRQRIDTYWRPYHERLRSCLAALRERHGYALLWDAHSIRGEVAALFEGRLPDLSIGSNGGSSSAPEIDAVLSRIAATSKYSSVLNGRFKGGFITRHYGAPANRVFAVQLELAQRSYMDESTLVYDEPAAGELAGVLQRMLQAFQSVAAEL